MAGGTHGADLGFEVRHPFLDITVPNQAISLTHFFFVVRSSQLALQQ
jgi:hypothetical protein